MAWISGTRTSCPGSIRAASPKWRSPSSAFRRRRRTWSSPSPSSCTSTASTASASAKANWNGADIGLVLTAPRSLASIALAPLAGESIDGEPIDIDRYGPPDASLLGTTGEGAVVEETLVSDLLRSNCPVTGQPDWASVQVRYRGARIDRAGLLRYLVSFRTHAGFHEQCVEQVYCDLLQRCRPERLSVYARYTRRGGLDINPWRSSEPGQPANTRSVRQ
jgi:7-cyano-7-deazaguanine reductase